MRNNRLETKPNFNHYHLGFTLLELLVAVAIVAILVTAVGPSIQSIVIKNRITADINSLSAVAQRARFTAVDEQTEVILCPTSDYEDCETDWSNAKMAFIDRNINGARDSDETILFTSDPINSANVIYGISGSIAFDEQGAIDTAATITICPKDNDAAYASAVILSLFGRISVAVDGDGDGTKEDLSGSALSCS